MAQDRIIEASMPVAPESVSFIAKLQTIALCLAAIIIVVVYIGIPLAQAFHAVVRPLIQDAILAVSAIIEGILGVIYIMAKTQANRRSVS